jgi:hypothetical protein
MKLNSTCTLYYHDRVLRIKVYYSAELLMLMTIPPNVYCIVTICASFVIEHKPGVCICSIVFHLSFQSKVLHPAKPGLSRRHIIMEEKERIVRGHAIRSKTSIHARLEHFTWVCCFRKFKSQYLPSRQTSPSPWRQAEWPSSSPPNHTPFAASSQSVQSSTSSTSRYSSSSPA